MNAATPPTRWTSAIGPSPQMPPNDWFQIDYPGSGRRLRYMLEALLAVIPGLDDVREGVKQFQ